MSSHILPYHIPPAIPFVYRLSDEILSDIFLYCCRSSPAQPLLLTDAPLSVAGVSSYWRRVALSSPHIWSCVSYTSSDHPDDIEDSHFAKSLDYCKTWLGRSGAVPLKLHVTSFSYIKLIDLDTMDLFRRHTNRVIEAQLFLRHGSLIQRNGAEVMAFVGFPKLERFTISYKPTIRDRYMFVDLSHLRILREVALLGNVHIAAIGSPLRELRRFTYTKENAASPFTGPTLLDSMRVLDRATGLQEINLRGLHARASIAHDIRMVCAQKLRKLTLVLDNAVFNGRLVLLDQVTLPALEDAEFHFQRATERGPLPDAHSVLSLFQRSKPQLQRLSIGGGCIDDTDLLEILRLSPTLKRLELMCHVFADLKAFLDRMTLRPGWSNNLCPNLETLVFFSCPWGVSGLGMADMIISRCIGHNPNVGAGTASGKLQRMYLHRMGYLDLWEDEVISDCVREGLYLLIT